MPPTMVAMVRGWILSSESGLDSVPLARLILWPEFDEEWNAGAGVRISNRPAFPTRFGSFTLLIDDLDERSP